MEVTLLATNLIKEQQYLDKLKMLWEKNWPAALPKELQYPFGEVQSKSIN